MLTSKRHGFLFIHIPKNGGSSIKAALRSSTMPRWQWGLVQTARRLRRPLWSDPQPFRAHTPASEILASMGQESFDSLFSFAIVRNPWDRQVSLFSFMLKDPSHPEHSWVRSLTGFDEFVRWQCAEGQPLQRDYVCSESDELLVDFVGRFENLQADFSTICDRIGITATLPHLNASNTTPYRQFYDAETRTLVAHHFAADIERFRYTF